MATNKILVILIFVSACLLLLQCEEAHAAEFVVGDEQGWSPQTNLSQWLEGKSFKARDVLIFRYTCQLCSFAAVISDFYYQICDAHGGLKGFHDSGNDHVVLDYGENYFVDNYYKYCENGMKLKIFAN